MSSQATKVDFSKASISNVGGYDLRHTVIRGVHGNPVINLDGTTTTTIDGIYGSPILNIGEGATNNEFHLGTSGSGRSWRVVLGEINKHENERVENWKNDLNALLIVGGLWSILVAFFTLESYLWLSEDPAIATVALLTQISQQLNNQNANFSTVTFRPAASVIRINCFWFLSLIMSMACILIGLLCKQWLHEHCRSTHTRTHMETLALQHLRIESLDRWGVPYIINQLPILLQLALVLFLVGLLELFWLSNAILFAIGLAAIGLIFLFYSATTYLSAIQILLHALKSQPYNDSPAATLSHLRSLGSVCPYKSPQSWAVFSVMRSVLQTSFVKHVLYRLSRGRPSFGPFQDAVDQNLSSVLNWSSFDLEVVRMFEGMKNAPSFHGVTGLQWLLRTGRDTESIPHLTNIVNSLPSTFTSLATSTAFNDWKLPLWKKLEKTDVEQALKDPITFFPRERSEAGLDPYGANHLGPSPQSAAFTQLLYYLSSWGNNDFDWKSRYEMTELLYRSEIPFHARMPFVVPFHEFEKLLCSPGSSEHANEGPMSRDYSERLYEQGIAIDFLHFYELGWTVASSLLDSGHHDKLALVKAITDHIHSYEFKPASSMLFTSSRGLDFLKFLDSRIKEERLNENGDWIFANIMPRWTRAFTLRSHGGDLSDLERWRSRQGVIQKVEPSDVDKDKTRNELAFARYPKIEPYPPTLPSLITPPRSPPPFRSQEYMVEYPESAIGQTLSSPESSLYRPSDYYKPIVRELLHADDQNSGSGGRVVGPSSKVIRYPSPVLSDESETIIRRRQARRPPSPVVYEEYAPRPPTIPPSPVMYEDVPSPSIPQQQHLVRRPPSPVIYEEYVPRRPTRPPSPSIPPPQLSWYRPAPSYGRPRIPLPPMPSSSNASGSASAKGDSDIPQASTSEDDDEQIHISPPSRSGSESISSDRAETVTSRPPPVIISVPPPSLPQPSRHHQPQRYEYDRPRTPQSSWYRHSPNYDRGPIIPPPPMPSSSYASGSTSAKGELETQQVSTSEGDDKQIHMSSPTPWSPPSIPIVPPSRPSSRSSSGSESILLDLSDIVTSRPPPVAISLPPPSLPRHSRYRHPQPYEYDRPPTPQSSWYRHSPSYDRGPAIPPPPVPSFSYTSGSAAAEKEPETQEGSTSKEDDEQSSPTRYLPPPIPIVFTGGDEVHPPPPSSGSEPIALDPADSETIASRPVPIIPQPPPPPQIPSSYRYSPTEDVAYP